MNKVYTIEELQALPDGDLNALAAELRGFYNHPLAFSLYDTNANGRSVEICEKSDWQPTTDRNQSGELLTWAWRTHGILFHIGFTGGASMGYVQYETAVEFGTIKGNNARAETVAFCAAMLAMTGRLK